VKEADRNILCRAKELLLKRGWHQGAYTSEPNGSGAVCIVAACDAASLEARGVCWGSSGALAALSKLISPEWDLCLGRWNDAVYRRFDEVLALIDRALLDLEHEEAESSGSKTGAASLTSATKGLQREANLH
jgi:hypothetical protein